MGVLTAPVRFLTEASTDVRGYFFAVSENRRLRERLKEMERWRDAAIALKNVNERYEQLLHLRTEPAIPMISARIVSDARGPFSTTRLADAGAAQGVVNGQPVLSEHGVVGRVVGVGPQASRVLLLTDVDSRTPVLIDRSNARAILTGDGGPNPRLEYLRGGGEAIRAGDILLTSGDGGVYPRGLPVGVAAKDVRGIWRARMYADRQALDYVRILTYVDFGRLAKDAAVLATTPPPLDPLQQAQLQAALAARAAPPPGSAPAPTTAAPAAAPLAAVAASATPRTGAPAAAPAARSPAAAAQPGSARPATRAPTSAPTPQPTSATAAARRGAATTMGATAATTTTGAARPAARRVTASGASTTAPAASASVSRPRAAASTATGSSTPSTTAARRDAAPPGETAEERARRLRLRELTRDAARPKATMRPVPDPNEDAR